MLWPEYNIRFNIRVLLKPYEEISIPLIERNLPNILALLPPNIQGVSIDTVRPNEPIPSGYLVAFGSTQVAVYLDVRGRIDPNNALANLEKKSSASRKRYAQIRKQETSVTDMVEDNSLGAATSQAHLLEEEIKNYEVNIEELKKAALTIVESGSSEVHYSWP
jgi:hypothetical protein